MAGTVLEKQELIGLLEPTLQSLGYELVDIDLMLGGSGLLRLYIDKDRPITLADCGLVSEQIGAFLDVEDLLPGRYTLEVSSPGTDRRLRTAEHYIRFVGNRVKLDLAKARDGRRRFEGLLTGYENGQIELDGESEVWQFKLDEIALAKLVPSD